MHHRRNTGTGIGIAGIGIIIAFAGIGEARKLQVAKGLGKSRAICCC
jgi:hypothetical protein